MQPAAKASRLWAECNFAACKSKKNKLRNAFRWNKKIKWDKNKATLLKKNTANAVWDVGKREGPSNNALLLTCLMDIR